MIFCMIFYCFCISREPLKAATANALELLRETVRSLGKNPPQRCACHDALEAAIWSDKSRVDRGLVRRLDPILGRHFSNE